jgi:MFS family permease
MTAAAISGSWADVLGQGRLPRFVLICLAVWLNAADTLIAATIMPSVGRSLGGYAYFGWATAGYLMGSVLAAASSGVFALRLGLRWATVAAALLYAAGCVLSAVAPEIFTFLAGRVMQGIGGGWLVGLSSVAIGLLFANRLLPRVYSAISSVWGVAVLAPWSGGCSPMPAPGAPSSGCSRCKASSSRPRRKSCCRPVRPRRRRSRWRGGNWV